MPRHEKNYPNKIGEIYFGLWKLFTTETVFLFLNYGPSTTEEVLYSKTID